MDNGFRRSEAVLIEEVSPRAARFARVDAAPLWTVHCLDSHGQRQTYFPAPQPAPQAQARFPCAHAHEGRASHHCPASPEGSRSPDGLTPLSPSMQRRNRLGSQSLISRVYQTGVRVRSRGVTLTALPEGAFTDISSDETVPPRIAVVASRRVGGSVVRNRARRRLRAAVDPVLKVMTPGSAAVLAATPETPTMDFQKLAVSVRSSLEKAGLLGSNRA